MRVATCNVNGIRAAQRRGFGDWLAGARADVVALQEVRCPTAALPAGVFADYHVVYTEGNRAGRNGVALLTHQGPAAVRAWDLAAVAAAPGGAYESACQDDGLPLARGLRPFAGEGRYLEVDLAEVPLTVASLYLPKGDSPTGSGRRGEADPAAALARYERKMAFLAGFARQLRTHRLAAAARGRHYLICGDFNIACTKLDLKNWRSNQAASGFLPEERDWFASILSPRTLIDVVRTQHPGVAGPYTWWSWMGNAFNNDTGWRIDYQLASPQLARTAKNAWVDRPASYQRRISDHAPVLVDYDLAGL